MEVVNVIDGIWILLAILGMGVSLWSLWDGFADRRALRDEPTYDAHGPRAIVVRLNLRAAGAGLILHSFFLILGTIAVTAVLRPRPTMFYVLLAAGYILVAGVNVRAIGLNQIDRFRLRARR